MNRVITLPIITAIICLTSSTYGDYADDDHVVSRQRRETRSDSNGLTIGTIFLILALAVAALILRWIIIDSCRRCCYAICGDDSPTDVTVIQTPVVHVINNGQNNLGFVQPSQPEINQDLPPPYNPSEYTKQVPVSDCKSNYTQPK